MHPKIQPSHLEKIAFLYLRQSSLQQLNDHKESLRVQRGLEDKLYDYGFSRVVMIDMDLGKSAAGYTDRPGFAKILNEVCLGRAGAVAAWEASRLARNHFEWQNLIRFCQITGTLVIDESGVYDPTNIDDIVMLGIKATLCQYELDILAKRACAGLLEKAKRGQLHTLLPCGYYLTDDGQYEMDPDERVQKTVKALFDKFDELGTIRQVHLWFVENKIEFPIVHYHRGGRREMTWAAPDYQLIKDALKNPTYAGAYVWGRRETRTFIRDGQPVKTSGHPLPIDEWKVLIVDHHQGYIRWEKFLKNQEQIRENSNKSPFSRGAAKKGKSLLAGLISCGHCGRKLAVKYSGRNGKSVSYLCRGAFNKTGESYKCFSTAARKLEQAVVQEVLKTIQPAAITAAIEAEKQLHATCSERKKQIELALEHARYEAARRQRQFNAIEPENRLVLREVQALWDQALAKVASLERDLKKETEAYHPLTDSQRQKLYALASDLPRLWNLPSTDDRTKTRITRTLIENIIARAEPRASGYNCFTIRWAGGVHSEIRVRRQQKGESSRKTSGEVIGLVKELVFVTDDKDIARILNRCGLKTATGQNWNQSRVRWLRRSNQIPAFSETDFENSDIVNLSQAAEHLQISSDAVKRLIKSGLLQAKQVVRYAPWTIRRSELEKISVHEAAQSIKKNGKAKIQVNQQQLNI